MSDYEDSGSESENDLTRTFKEVDASFIVHDARKSFGPTFDPHAIVDESDLSGSDECDRSVSDGADLDSPLAVIRPKNICRLISSDESSADNTPEIELGNHIEEISSDSDQNGEAATVTATKKLSGLVIEISSEEEEDFVVSFSDPVGTHTPKPAKTTANQATVSPNQQISTSPVAVSSIPSSPATVSPIQRISTNFATASPVQQISISPVAVPPILSSPAKKPSPIRQEPEGNYAAALRDTTVEALLAKITEKKTQYSQFKAALRGSQPSQLPDGGQKLRDRMATLAAEVGQLERELESLLALGVATLPGNAKRPADLGRPTGPLDPAAGGERPSVARATIPIPQWSTIRNTADIQHGFGAKALESYTAERGSALATLSSLHAALESRPDELTLACAPHGLRGDVQLMPHQRRALAWLCWREAGPKPRGGILADDMGLGKTLTMISLVLKDLEERETDADSEEEETWTTTRSHGKKSVNGGTLVICPASLLSQWECEVRKRVRPDRMTVEIHHGPAREKRGYRLARRSMVVSTYAIARTEHVSKGALHQVHWRRIILDEAHVVRNHKSKTAEAIFDLVGRFRWCLTGTPVHNKELDLFALVRFIGCAPFDDIHVWKRWIDNKAKNGSERLNLLLGSLLLRRTKAQLQANQELQGLCTKELHSVPVTLTEREAAVYEKILAFSKSMFAQFLLQRHEREAAQLGVQNYQPLDLKNLHDQQAFEPGTRLGKMAAKYANMADIKSHVILVLLLRLRQTCVHPTLVSSMLDTPTLEPANQEEDDELAGALGRLQLRASDREEDDLDPGTEDAFWNPDNPVFDGKSISSKMSAVLDTLLTRAIAAGNDKAVVVSQWVSMLNLLENELLRKLVPCVKLCGETQVKERMKMVDDFNKPDSRIKVMLLSLTAGGVGLNLVGANHLLLCDLHWNPQLEAQACDRVFRVGQTKPVHIYKFVCKETIEENIQALQDRKMAIATDVLTGARDSSASKLSVDDLKMLFDMG